jgi:Domain of Unknown Function (DUF326)
MMTAERFESCIDACIACAIACEHCATECLKEESVKMMIRCIELDRECASVCRSAAELMSIGRAHASLLCNACADICEACAHECAMHEMDHCQECAEECEACAEACRKMVEHAV